MSLRIVQRVLTGTLVLAAAVSQAQTHPLRAQIPFAFQVDNAVLPAGSYIVDQPLPNLLRVYLEDKPGSSRAFAFVREPTTRMLDRSKLIFHCYAQQRCFLARVERGESAESIAVIPSRTEKQVRRESVLAFAQPGNPPYTEVASLLLPTR